MYYYGFVTQAKPPAVTAGSVKAEKPQTRKTLAKKKNKFFEEVINQLWDGLAWSKVFIGTHWSSHRWIEALPPPNKADIGSVFLFKP